MVGADLWSPVVVGVSVFIVIGQSRAINYGLYFRFKCILLNNALSWESTAHPLRRNNLVLSFKVFRKLKMIAWFFFVRYLIPSSSFLIPCHLHTCILATNLTHSLQVYTKTHHHLCGCIFLHHLVYNARNEIYSYSHQHQSLYQV